MSFIWTESKRSCKARGTQFSSTVVQAQDDPHGQSKLTILSLSNGRGLESLGALQSPLWHRLMGQPFGNCWSQESRAKCTIPQRAKGWEAQGDAAQDVQAGVPAPQGAPEPDVRWPLLTQRGRMKNSACISKAGTVPWALEGLKRPEPSQAVVYTTPMGKRCSAGRSAGRPLPHRSRPTLQVGRAGGNWNTSPNRSQALLGSNARSKEQHSKIIFIARAGMLKQAFLFLFMSWGSGLVLFASCSQRILWTAFFGYLTSAICLSPLTVNCTCCALGISQRINTKNRNKPSKTEGRRLLTFHWLLKLLPPLRKDPKQTHLETRRSRQFHKGAREERMKDAFPPPYTFAEVGELDCNGRSRYGKSDGKWGLGSSRGPGYRPHLAQDSTHRQGKGTRKKLRIPPIPAQVRRQHFWAQLSSWLPLCSAQPALRRLPGTDAAPPRAADTESCPGHRATWETRWPA